MALTAVSFGVINAGAVLTETALEGEFSNIYNNGEDLGWPATKAKDLDGQKLVLDTDGDTVLFSDTDDQVAIGLNSGTKVVVIEATAATAKNGFKMAVALSGQSPYLMPYAGGGDTVLDMSLRSLGSGRVVLADEDGNEIIEATVPASASVVNHIRVVAASAGAGPSIAAVGDDATINLGIGAKGTGLLSLGTGAPVEIGSLGKTITIGGLTWPTADGGVNQSIVTDGAGALTFGNPVGMTLISDISAVSAAMIDFTAIDSTYDEYEIRLLGLQESISAAGGDVFHLWMRFSTDGGATFIASAGAYQYAVNGFESTGSAQLINSTAATQIVLNSHTIHYTAAGLTHGMDAVINISRPSEALPAAVHWRGSSQRRTAPGQKTIAVIGSGFRPVAEAINAVRILPVARNMTGRALLYGIKKT